MFYSFISLSFFMNVEKQVWNKCRICQVLQLAELWVTHFLKGDGFGLHIIGWCLSENWTILFFRICDPIPILLLKRICDPILSPSWEKDLRSDTIRSFSILFRSFFDPFPIFITNFYGHFITQKLSQVINKKSDKFWSFYGNKNDSKFLHLTKKCFFKFSNKYFQADIMKKLVYFLKKGSGTESDPFRSDPWFFGSTIRSRSSKKRI